MADENETLGPQEPTIAIRATQCLESFKQCLLQASSVHYPREFSVVEDQMARLSTWAASLEVFAHGQAAIDHRLRFAREVQSAVTGLLESLDYRISACSDVLNVLDKFPASNVQNASNERLERCIVDIATEINRLDKASNTIRRASQEAHLLNVSDSRITEDDGTSVEPFLLSHFENHVSDRFPNISKIIQQRLARTMLLRQKRVLHRRHYQKNVAIQPQKAILKASITLPALQPGAPATTLASDNFKIASSSSSVISASKTVTFGTHEALIFPPVPGLAARRRYEQLKSQREADFYNALWLGEPRANAESELEELLKSDLQDIGEITCPYCLYALPVQEILDEQKWQNHVMNDLDPYVCLFKDCEEADLLYNHSDEWLSHLHRHNKLWRCSSHLKLGPFSTREDYIRHMREAHHTNFSDAQLRVLAKKNARKAAKLFLSCPLCDKDAAEVDGRLEDHIAEHLISLALKSLPSYQDEILDDDGGEEISIEAPPQSRSTVSHLVDDEDMLEPGTEQIRGRHRDPSPSPFGNSRAQSFDGSLSSRSSTSLSLSTVPSTSLSLITVPSAWPSLNTKLSTNRLSIGEVPLRPTPQPITSGATGRIFGSPIPKKPRGKRSQPLTSARRELAKRRNERHVCIGCKMAKVMCDGMEHGKECTRCASSHTNAPKPFVCTPASFFELIQQSSTVLFVLHTIYPLSSSGIRQPIQLPSEINIRHLLHVIDELQRDSSIIRVYEGHHVLYELDLQGCWGYINSACSPSVHPFQSFINGLKLQRQDSWKMCIRDNTGRLFNTGNLCDALLALDDMAPWVTYSLIPKPTIPEPNSPHSTSNDRIETALYPDNGFNTEIIIVAAQLSRIIGRKLELQFYDHLKKALANPSISSELVFDIGRILISLRRRLVLWARHNNSSSSTSMDEIGVDDNNSSPVHRIKNICQVFYVYFCYLRRRLSAGEQEGLRTIMVWHPDSGQTIEENFPQHESISGFTEWLQYKDQPILDQERAEAL